MSVGAFQERSVCVARQLGYGLLVYAMMEQGRDHVVTKGVQMERLGETILLENLPQVFCERVWVDNSDR